MLLYGSNQAVLNFGAGIIFMVQDTKLRMTSFPVKIELSFFVFIEVYTPTDQAIIVSSICFSKLSTSRLVTEATPPWAK